jgi:hypothetical protein
MAGRVRSTPTRNSLDIRRMRISRMRPLTTLLIPHSTTAPRILLAPLRPSTTPLLSHRPSRRTTRTITTTNRASLLNLEHMLLHPYRPITEQWTSPNTTCASQGKHLLLPCTITSCAVYEPRLKSPPPLRAGRDHPSIPSIIAEYRVTMYRNAPLYSDSSLLIYAPRSGPLVLRQ